MDKERAFELAKRYLEKFESWIFVEERLVMAGLKEVKRRFGFLSHRCPLCREKMRYFNVLCNPRGAEYCEPRVLLPLPRGCVSWGAMAMLRGELELGTCTRGHETARVYTDFNAGEPFSDYLVSQFCDDQVVFIACS